MPPVIDNLFFRLVDARSYALVRICVALAALYNWGQIFYRRQQFLGGPISMVDAETVERAIAKDPYWSIFNHAHGDAAATAVCLGALVAILLLGVGLFSNVSAILVWAWHLSYSHHMFPTLHSWDAVLRVFTFLLMISPCGAAWSLDAVRAARKAGVSPRDVSPLAPSYGLVLMQWQLAIIYVVTVWLKVPDRSWRSGTLLAYFQMSIYSRTPDWTFLARYEIVSAIMTYASLAIELAIPFLLFSRSKRLLGVLLGIGLHAGIAMQSKLLVFSLCILAPYPAFFEGRDIAWAEALLQRTRKLLPTRTSL